MHYSYQESNLMVDLMVDQDLESQKREVHFLQNYILLMLTYIYTYKKLIMLKRIPANCAGELAGVEFPNMFIAVAPKV